MKRALALFTVLLFGVAAFAQVSGSWSGTLKLDLSSSPPSVSLSTTLVLSYSVAGFDITSTSKFDSSWTSQKFELSGTFGPFDLKGWMDFDPGAPAYKASALTATLNFAGLDIDASVEHYDFDYLSDYDIDWHDYCDQTPAALMFYKFGVTVEPVSVKTTFVDCCTGIEFYDLTISLDDLSLCCGITYDFEFYFKKTGFEYVLFSIDKLFDLCCGISFGVDVKFTVDAKSVTPKFSWGGIEGCVTVWGDVVTAEDEDLNWTGLTGWELYGYKIYCELAECYSLEIVTAFDVAEVEKVIGDVFKGDEFEYIKLSACGPACCGGTWNLSVATYFGPSGTLFDITRFKADASVPIMDALTISLSYETPNTLSLGWEFKF